MPPQLLFDISGIDLTQFHYPIEVVRECNPQRGAMEHLDGIVYCNPPTGDCLGVKTVREDEFWVPGHIPGRPLLPGVIMLEAAAQVASFYTKKIVGWPGFIGFGGVEECKFRAAVGPGKKLYILTHLEWQRHRRIACTSQGLVDGNLAFEAIIIGTQM